MIAMLWAQWIMLEKKTYAQVPRLLKDKHSKGLPDYRTAHGQCVSACQRWSCDHQRKV